MSRVRPLAERQNSGEAARRIGIQKGGRIPSRKDPPRFRGFTLFAEVTGGMQAVRPTRENGI